MNLRTIVFALMLIIPASASADIDGAFLPTDSSVATDTGTSAPDSGVMDDRRCCSRRRPSPGVTEGSSMFAVLIGLALLVRARRVARG